ncbi:DUF2577 domain-containing protein [Clostridioides mangenotii]|uniref:DUF2577 domain-containing protein n=1 Tax=Metaclostridioides mangenotii TaxID=1540 RepID=UPI002149E899|nr:DUF2577 domain-containing protein [Clostridioides mangenotii]MCR1955148.1 DUF2577 domain-containing protein [Clostridioides mangenotii]
MADIYNAIKEVCHAVVKSYNLTSVLYAKVIQVEPLRVQLDAEKFLGEPLQLVLTSRIKELRSGLRLKNGDMVALISYANGQQYLVVDKV